MHGETFSDSLVLDMRIWWCLVDTLCMLQGDATESSVVGSPEARGSFRNISILLRLI